MSAILLHGGTIRTFADGQPTVDELLVVDDRVAARTGDEPERFDLQGGCVLPAFTDSHTHFPTWSVAQRQVRLEDTKTIEEALDRIAAAARELPPNTWLRGLGWRAMDWHPHTEPTREMLDRVAPGVPIALMARDYHSLWVSSAGLERADQSALLVPGGVVETDETGRPTGVLREESAWNFRDRWASPTREEYLDALKDGLAIAASRGVAAIHDKDGWLGALELFGTLRAEDALTLRVWQSLPHDRLPEIEAIGLHSGFGDDWLRVGYIKAFMDGTLGSRTARLLDGSGVEVTSGEDFERIVRRSARAGFPVAVHAIGDLANQEALDAFEAARDEWEPLGLRQRIEHAQLLAPGDAERYGRLGITASVQFSHATSDRDLADEIWTDATDRAYAFRTLLDAGARVVNGSDAPVEELDPLAGIAAAQECGVTYEEALESFTAAPAWLEGAEDRRGRLSPGFGADLVILDGDGVRATMVAGEWVHGSPA